MSVEDISPSPVSARPVVVVGPTGTDGARIRRDGIDWAHRVYWSSRYRVHRSYWRHGSDWNDRAGCVWQFLCCGNRA
jgi:lipoprotein-anchoring transpeptidase ErfK/SrfK